jgi:holliday junction DNA helicase RuvA
MIAHLSGTVESTGKSSLILDVGGVGFFISVPQIDIDEHLAAGLKAKLHTYLAVRQDAMELFGFTSELELQLFRMLIKIKGIGPKAGVNILSHIRSEDLALALINEDAARLEGIPGVGKKTAQRLILELKGKNELLGYLFRETAPMAGAGPDSSGQVIEILKELGCTENEARDAVSKTSKKLKKGEVISPEAMLTSCLEIIGAKK